MNASSLEKQIIDELNERPANRMARARVAYSIIRTSGNDDDLVNQVRMQYIDGFEDKLLLAELADKLTKARSLADMPADRGNQNMALFNLAWNMLPNEDRLDGRLAQCYFMWGEGIGLPRREVARIFDDHL